MKKKTIVFAFPVTWHQFQKIRTLVFNTFKINLCCVTESAKDTEFMYVMMTEDRINKETKIALGHFIHGIICCMKSF